MIDLRLEHLDVDVGNAGPQVDQVVCACGESASRGLQVLR
jgi:hypothetical protein